MAFSLGKAADNKLILPKNISKCMSLCLDFIDNLDNEDAYLSYRVTFPKLAKLLNHMEEDLQTKIVTDIFYPKITMMIDRKQERKRRVRGC